MKKYIVFLFFFLPLISFAQNYEQQGDELFAQAQYEKAEKKYNAAIAMTGETPALKTKKANCSKCASLLSNAKAAEESASSVANYERASKLYNDLYAVHALQAYKDKAESLKRKATKMKKENAERVAQAERAERERQAKIEAQRIAKAEAERQARIEKERKAKEEKAAREREAREQQERQRKAQEKAERAKKERETLKTGITQNDLTILMAYPMGKRNCTWQDSKTTIEKCITSYYPELKVKGHKIYGKLQKERPTIRLESDVEVLSLSYVSIDLNTTTNNGFTINYLFATPITYGVMRTLSYIRGIVALRFTIDSETNTFFGKLYNGVKINELDITESENSEIKITFTIFK